LNRGNPVLRNLGLFSGIGGFELGLEWAGIETVAFCERDKQCKRKLSTQWPGIPIIDDIRDLLNADRTNDFGTINVVTGGDPCPIRSEARSTHGAIHPDLSGYFIAVVGRCRPRWVVRENVPASDDIEFSTALELLGYGTIIIRANSFPVTAQNRTRDFIVGCDNRQRIRNINELFKKQSGNWLDTKGNQSASGYPCLTTQRKRYDSCDGYIWDGERLRVADKTERTRLAGFPEGWLDGFSETACARMLGNSVTPKIAYLIAKAILEVEANR
jgi:site-specific DNA-cytosine methylase